MSGDLLKRDITKPWVLPADDVKRTRIDAAGTGKAFLHLTEAIFARLEKVLPFIKAGESVLAQAVKIPSGLVQGVWIVFQQSFLSQQVGRYPKISGAPAFLRRLKEGKFAFIMDPCDRTAKLSVCNKGHSAVTMRTFADAAVLYTFDLYYLFTVGTGPFLHPFSLLVVIEEIPVLLHQVVPNPIYHRLRQRTDLLHHLVNLFSDFVTSPVQIGFPNFSLIVPQDLDTIFPCAEKRKWRVFFAPYPHKVGVLRCHVVLPVVYAKNRVQGSIAGFVPICKLGNQLRRFLKGTIQRFAVVGVNGQDQQVTLCPCRSKVVYSGVTV